MRMDQLKHQIYKMEQINKSSLEPENNFKLINISINEMDKLLKEN